MMWTPIGEGTFEYSQSNNRLESFVDAAHGGLIAPRRMIDTMGFAVVGAPSPLFVSSPEMTALTRSATVERLLNELDDDDDEDDEDDDEDEEDHTDINDEEKKDHNNEEEEDHNDVNDNKENDDYDGLLLGTTERYASVLIRCAACLFTVTLGSVYSSNELNCKHVLHCPECAFVRRPFVRNPKIATYAEISYKWQFSHLTAIRYSPCSECECRHIPITCT